MNRKTYCAGLFLTTVMTVTGVIAQDNTWFNWATTNAGLDTARAFNIFVTDINNDRYPDFVSLKGDWGVGAENALRVYINVRDTASSDASARMFVDVTGESGANSMPGAAAVSKGVLVAALADVNNDGNVDLVRGNYYHTDPAAVADGRCEVLLGDGQGRFTLVPDNGLHELGVINVTGMSFLDYDKDGNIDLFIGRWFQNYALNTWSPGILMKGNGDGTFTNVSSRVGITSPEPMYGCSVVDWNNDGWPDIATAPYCRTNGQLWKNNGDGTFTDVAVSAGYNARYMPGDNGQALCMWSAVPEDYDNDGDMDFFFSLVHGGTGVNEGRSAIALNGGAGNDYKLTLDRSLMTRNNPQASHLGDYDGSWFDIDNDGLMDLAMAQGHYDQPNPRLYVFRQNAGHHLLDITGDVGLVRTESNNLHLLEVMDYDLDGDDDILFCKDALPRELHLVENRIGQDNSWTGVRLHAPQGVNKSCIGARIYVWSGGVQRMREVYAGRGNSSGQQPFAMLFGLGISTSIDSIRIVWPDNAGNVTIIRNPPVNEYLDITMNGLSVSEHQPSGNGNVLLKLYPNPAKNFILVQLSNNDPVERVEIYDILGRSVNHMEDLSSGEVTVYCSIEQLLPGQYMIKVISASGDSFSNVFMKSW